MKNTHYRWVGFLWVIVWAAAMVVAYASGMLHPATTLPESATVSLQNRWMNRKNSESPISDVQGTFDYSQFEKVYSILKSQYYDQDKVSTGAMLDGALKWMVSALRDPYTTFLDTKENTSFTQELKWQQDFEGIGAAVLKKDDAIEIQEVYKWTPSFEAWLRPLDLVVQINGEKTKDMTTDEAVSKIRWPEGTTVDLTIVRPGETNPAKQFFTLTITRKKVSIPSVTSKVIMVGNKKIGYIDITIIGQQTEKVMKSVVQDLKSQGVQWMILDLRGNGGWFLDIGVEVASHFIDEGKTVVTTRYRLDTYNETYPSKWYAEFAHIPTVVLMDSLTASAGEIIAAALQELQGAILMGTKTYGKGSIQTIQDFTSWTAIKYTIGKWYTPHDENVTGTGLLPDIEVPFDFTGYQKGKIDNQLEAAKKEVAKLIK